MRITNNPFADAPGATPTDASRIDASSPRPLQRTGDLELRSSPSTTPPGSPRLRTFQPLPADARAEITAGMDEVRRLLDSGGMKLLQSGLKDGFQTLPTEYRGLGSLAARMLGLSSEPAPAGSNMTYPELRVRLGTVADVSAQLIAASQLTLENSLGTEPNQRAAMLAPYLTQLRDAGRVVGAAIAQTKVGEFRADRDFTISTLEAWSDSTATLHDQIEAQFGETHPLTAVALEARGEASNAFSKTMVRMAIAKAGSKMFDWTLGPALSKAAQWYAGGSGSA